MKIASSVLLVLEAEAVRVPEALSWLFKMPYPYVTINTDALPVVSAMHRLEVGSVL